MAKLDDITDKQISTNDLKGLRICTVLVDFVIPNLCILINYTIICITSC